MSGLTSTYASLHDVELCSLAATGERRAFGELARRHGSAVRYLLRRMGARIDGIATPTLYHHSVARDFLRAGVSLLVEKPLASTPEQARDLVETAREHGATLQVGHIEIAHAP